MLTTEDTENTEAATPETDAEVTTFTSISKLKRRFECSTGKVSADFARRLERERDDAREERDKLKQLLLAADSDVDAYLGLMLQRDEARELAQQMSESNQVLMADVRFYRNAWEQIKEGAK